MFWVQIILFVVSTVLQAILAPKPTGPKPLSITDFDVPTAEEGRPIPVVFGEVLVKGPNVVWYGDLYVQKIKSKKKKK